MANRVLIACGLKKHLGIEPDYLNKFITGDETWVFEYDLET